MVACHPGMPRRGGRRTRASNNDDQGKNDDVAPMDMEEKPRSSSRSRGKGGGGGAGGAGKGNDRGQMCPLDLRQLEGTQHNFEHYQSLFEKGVDKEGLEGWLISDLNDMLTELTLMKEAALERAEYVKAQHEKLVEWETQLALSQGTRNVCLLPLRALGCGALVARQLRVRLFA